MKTLGHRIRELREKKDFSTRQLAKTAELSIAFISDIELGRRLPSKKVLAAIAKSLGTTLEELQEYDTRPIVEEFKRRIELNPKLGFAFQRLMEANLSPEEMMKLADKKTKRKKR